MSRCVRADRCARQGSLSGALKCGCSMRRDLRFVRSVIHVYSCDDVLHVILRCCRLVGPRQNRRLFSVVSTAGGSPESTNIHQSIVMDLGVVIHK